MLCYVYFATLKKKCRGKGGGKELRNRLHMIINRGGSLTIESIYFTSDLKTILRGWIWLKQSGCEEEPSHGKSV